MKIFLLILILVCIAFGVTIQGKVVVIKVVIPANLQAYYDWLMTFPGFDASAETLPFPEREPIYDTQEL